MEFIGKIGSIACPERSRRGSIWNSTKWWNWVGWVDRDCDFLSWETNVLLPQLSQLSAAPHDYQFATL